MFRNSNIQNKLFFLYTHCSYNNIILEIIKYDLSHISKNKMWSKIKYEPVITPLNPIQEQNASSLSSSLQARNIVNNMKVTIFYFLRYGWYSHLYISNMMLLLELTRRCCSRQSFSLLIINQKNKFIWLNK